MKLRSLASLATITAALCLSSCIDQDQTLTVNPDGSGKIEIKFSAAAAPAFGAGGAMPKQSSKDIAMALLSGTEGIDVWSTLTHSSDAAGKNSLTATGYFPDLNKLKIKIAAGGMMQPDSSSGSTISSGSMTSRKDADGNWVIEMASAADAAGEKAAPSTLPEDEVKKQLAAQKEQWAGAKPMVSMMMGGFKVKNTIIAGGTITKSGGFDKKDDHTASLEMNGEKLMAALDKINSDDALLREMVASGGARNPKGMKKMLMPLLSGGVENPSVTLKPGAPVFDYAAEVAKAKSAQSEELKTLITESKTSRKVVPPTGSVPRPPSSGPKPAAPAAPAAPTPKSPAPATR